MQGERGPGGTLLLSVQHLSLRRRLAAAATWGAWPGLEGTDLAKKSLVRLDMSL